MEFVPGGVDFQPLLQPLEHVSGIDRVGKNLTLAGLVARASRDDRNSRNPVFTPAVFIPLDHFCASMNHYVERENLPNPRYSAMIAPFDSRAIQRLHSSENEVYGEVDERFKSHAWKACVG